MLARALLLTVVLTATAEGTAMAESAANTRAADHFDRGVRRYNDGDNSGALAEFRAAYEQSRESFILYNIGLVLAGLERPVEAVAALDQVIKDPGKLSPERLERARRIRDEQGAKVGKLVVTSNVEAEVEIDGTKVARTPMDAPVPLAAGTRLLALTAPGHTPQRRQIQVPAGQVTTIQIDLAPSATALATLTLASPLPGAEIWLDGKAVGKTPLRGTLPVPAGRHEVVLRRPGYSEARQDVTLAAGATEHLALDLLEAPAPGDPVGTVTLAVSEPDATVLVDGQPRPRYREGLRLPAGAHRLVVKRSGFFDVERDISSTAGVQRTIRVTLEPNEETRATYVNAALGQRWRAWVTVGLGAIVAGGSTWLYVRNREEQRLADEEFAEVGAMLKPGGQCFEKIEMAEGCKARVDHANARVDSAERTRWLTVGGIAVGGAAVLTGLVLALISDDPGRYDPERPTGDLEHRLSLWAGPRPGGGTVGLVGRF